MAIPATIEALKGKKFKALALDAVKGLSDVHAAKLKLLQGREVTYVEVRRLTKPFNCVLCGHSGTVAHVVKNEKGEERFCGASCLEKYFGIKIKASGAKKTSAPVVDL